MSNAYLTVLETRRTEVVVELFMIESDSQYLNRYQPANQYLRRLKVVEDLVQEKVLLEKLIKQHSDPVSYYRSVVKCRHPNDLR